MSSRNLDLLIVIAFTILALGTTVLPSNSYRMVPDGIVTWSLLALPLVLVLPGYALTAALFPRGSLGIPETLTSSIGLSLAAVIVGGVLLNVTADGLIRSSWMIFLVVVTLAGCAIAARRRGVQPAPALKPFSLRVDIRPVLLIAASIFVVVYALMIVRDETLQPPTAFTELWAKPAAVLGQTAFDIGVHNSESSSMEYELQVKAGETLFESVAIALAPGETWEKVVIFQSLVSGDIQVSLYRMDDPGTIYRQVVSRSETK